MKEYEITENKIFIKNNNNLKRSIIVVAIATIIATIVICYYHPNPSVDLLFFRPSLTFHLPIFLVLCLIVMILISFNYLLFDAEKQQLFKHTVFGTRKICEFNELSKVKKIDVYTNSVHSRINYELVKKGKEYAIGIILCSFFPSQYKEIQEFEEKIIPTIHQFIEKQNNESEIL